MIHCGECHKVLKDNDLVTMDFMNRLRHYVCLGVPLSWVEDINFFGELKRKYKFLR